MPQSLSLYRTVDIQGKSPLDLVLTVYQGAISAYQEASRHFEEHRYEAGRDSLENARRFVVHLFTTLDHQRGGELADHLGQLYSFVINETSVVAATKDQKRISDIIKILDNLRQGWLGLKERQEAAGSRPSQVLCPDAFDAAV